jgi:plasmid stabilization system protein ParE
VKVRWTSEARDDLRGIVDYIAERDPDAADALLDRILQGVEILADGRFDGPESRPGGRPARSWLIAPYRLHYVRDGEFLIVMRLYDGRRQPL